MCAGTRNSATGYMMYCALAATAMAYGWGYRGTVGHEGGAMVPGALLGLVLCLGSGRLDWYQRAAVVGLFAAVGWAWGGSISYMEHTFYVMSNSFPDVLYGYTMLFFIGALWAGCGGAILGLGLTEPRSELERLTRPFIAVGVVVLVVYLYFLVMPEHKEACETFTVRHFHDGDWLPATLALVVSAVYWVARPQDRRGVSLFFWAAVAWWIGYGLLTKIGGLRLAPLHRSESWSGVLGLLVALMIYLIRRRNRAALMLCLYGILGGGLAYVLAVFIRHPLTLRWGPLANMNLPWPAWTTAEVSFGFFMGLALALGALRLLRGGLTPPDDDTERAPLDTFAVFVMLVALIWMNFRRHFVRVLAKSDATAETTFLHLQAGGWYLLLGALATAPLLYGLYRYWRGDRLLVPQSAFGKGFAITLLLVWMTVAGQVFDAYPTRASLIWNLLHWLPAVLTSCLLVGFSRRAGGAVVPVDANIPPSDSRWRVGTGYALTCAVAPVFILCVTGMSMGMQDDADPNHGRKRFGPDAYWRQTERLVGTWEPVGRAGSLEGTPVESTEFAITRLGFDAYRNVEATLPSGEVIEAHRWFLKNQYTWLHWYGKVGGHAERAQVPLQFRGQRLYISWPPRTQKEGYLVFERIDDD